jgi:ubiquinone biosynthesis O-methyltransferase
MKVNNEIYETQGHGWWVNDAGFGFSSLRLCLNPVRYGYFKRKMSQMKLSVKTILDVGCGGGYLAEAFARDGFIVAGVDPAVNSIEAARKHAFETGLDLDYRVGRSETLPFSDGSFDAVACCDVLEHVDDLDRSVSEVARVLRPGGVFFYETVDRTWLSKLVLIKVWQDWQITRLCEPTGRADEETSVPWKDQFRTSEQTKRARVPKVGDLVELGHDGRAEWKPGKVEEQTIGDDGTYRFIVAWVGECPAVGSSAG